MFWAERIQTSPTSPSAQSCPAGVHHAQFNAVDRLAGRTQQMLPRTFRVMVFGRQAGDRAGGLGQAVDLDEAALERAHGVNQHLFRDRRGAIGNCLERAVVGRAGAWDLKHELDHRRHHEGMRDAVLGDRGDGLSRVEVRVEHAHPAFDAVSSAMPMPAM
jgi:hypothetical protein